MFFNFSLQKWSKAIEWKVERYARKRINHDRKIGQPRDAKKWPSGQIFLYTPNSHNRFLCYSPAILPMCYLCLIHLFICPSIGHVRAITHKPNRIYSWKLTDGFFISRRYVTNMEDNSRYFSYRVICRCQKKINIQAITHENGILSFNFTDAYIS